MRKNNYDKYNEIMFNFKSMFETTMKIVEFVQNYENLKSLTMKNVTFNDLVDALNKILTMIILQ